jgi:chromosome segregation ATPase
MSENDDLTNIPPMVPERDDVDSHLSNKRSQSQDIVRPSYYTQKMKVSTWPVRIMLILLTLGMGGGGYGAYYVYNQYQTTLRQSELRIGDLELRLAIAGEFAEESDSNLMENIEKTVEQYDLLWANWRRNNQQFDDIQGEIAKLKMANEGQDETAVTQSQSIAATTQSLMANETRLNSLGNEMQQLDQSVNSLNASVDELDLMRSDVESIRQALNSGDSTVLGLVGRLEYIEESMESINAHRLQINESLFRLQESIEALQRMQSSSGASL